MCFSLSASLCQTVLLKSEVQQCPHEVATQMNSAGCFVSCVKDRIVSPGPYVTANQFHDRRLKAVSPALTHRDTNTDAHWENVFLFTTRERC